MFFTTFSLLSEQEVNAKVIAQPRAQSGVGYCKRLAGKSLKLKLAGEFAPSQLDYTFKDEAALTVIENGKSYDAPYAAVSLGRVTLFTHLIPGTSRGWHIVYDTETELVTAFETWFGVEVPVGGDLFGGTPTGTRQIYREVQRQWYFGYNDKGQAAPEKTHTFTNRIEGRGLYWKFDSGYEKLTFFPSVICSTTVDLSDPEGAGGITMTTPSDYIKIDDEYYIYTSWEVEFSGASSIEILNFFDMKAAGLRFGLDEKDTIDYCLHKADIEITGDAAHLEPIGSYGNKGDPLAGMGGAGGGAKKGARYAYRPMDMDPPMTREEAMEHAKNQHIFEGGGLMTGGNNLETSEYLIGKKFKVKLDGEYHTAAPWSGTKSPIYEYDVISVDKLKWRLPGGTWQEETYKAFEPAKDIILFSHMLTGDPDYANLTQAVDFSNGLATTVKAQVGNWHSPWEIGAHAKFGVLEYGDLVAPFARRHHFSTDLVGKTYAWAYSDNMSSIHVYSSPESYSWTIFNGENGGGATWSSPCFYIKLRDDAYIFQWVEENCNGSQGLVVFNPKILHDGGFFFGVGHRGLSLNVTGAFARSIGKFDIMKYFDKKINL
ncbi:MAG: hypothetical protein LBN43_09800 [Oscillospiraceae bacterium]|jgi:hypothetical protein|nr:hypothetical protein [Oscillospiraceae bacterium]